MSLSQAAHWKTASGKELTDLKKHGVFKLTPIASVSAGHKGFGTKWVLSIKAKCTYKGRLVVQGVSQILGMSVTRDRDKGAITISQKDYTGDVIQRYCMKGFNPAYAPGVKPELSLNQPEEKLLNEEKWCHQAATGAVMYLAQVTRYDILYVATQLARAMSKPAKAHMGAAKHLLRYLVGSTDFSITYKQGGFRLASFSDANWGKIPTMAGLRDHIS